MNKETQIKQINQALTKIRSEYSDLLKGISPQTVILAKVSNSLQNSDFDECAGLVCDLWESCEQAKQAK